MQCHDGEMSAVSSNFDLTGGTDRRFHPPEKIALHRKKRHPRETIQLLMGECQPSAPQRKGVHRSTRDLLDDKHQSQIA